MKTALKEKIRKRQNGKDALTGESISDINSLIDTDRKLLKKDGGIYTDENTRIVDPVAHMKRHGNYREREEQLNKLKILIDGREQLRKLINSIENRMLAVKRKTDNLDKSTMAFLAKEQKNVKKRLALQDRIIVKHLKLMNWDIIRSASDVRGVGPITIAYLISYIDIKKAKYASSLWSYVGFDKASHERYEKGVAGGGNKTLRTVLFNTGDSMIRSKSLYREIYDNDKARLEKSKKIVKSWNTQGKLIECEWRKTKPSHRHGAAKRKMLKHFLADFWKVWRTIEGLPTPNLYVEEKLGHTGIIKPEERGWIF